MSRTKKQSSKKIRQSKKNSKNTNHTTNSSNKTISLLSFNIYSRGCKSFDNKLVDKLLKDNNIDVLCTQEDGGDKIYKPISDYHIIKDIKHKSCGNDSFETVGVYEKMPNSINFDNCINSNQVYKHKKINRFSTVFNYENIKIANMHLEGGRYTDQKLLGDFTRLMPIKLSLLKLAIKQQPDIILGDFNSVYCSNKTRLNLFLKGQYDYFENVVKNAKLTIKEKQNIKLWNLAPFMMLKKHGYTYAKPDNEATMITNGRGNSIIDFIFYKKDKLKLESAKIINIINKSDDYKIYKCISDHNPISAKFIIL